ncbi:Pimeloyl-ACP methyl ester carboxylesterase [Alteribacillus persepolensis]|uniref:Pimeloyl-ACP methyl ester carboxylesterase n=1 Tax=Alteribacillus persepolensis TaxID=568899 RepID=A0A1G8JI01_9BACI|nr:alpha/beta hydrolase [Alteribacillus persepolensis]SDI30858.1 Pimeloyl-ACP methyl ester carboxylesterase [Alteribacillus persepolensis]
MNIEIDGVKVNYHVSGEGANVVLLHGWGANIQAFAPVHQSLEKHFKVWSIDFPGFGESEEPPRPWSVGDYTNMLAAFLKQLDIQDPILIGHSFGGRVSIKYASSHPVHKVVLVDSAGIKPKRSLKYYMKVYTYKTIKKLLKLPLIKRYEEDILTKVKGKVGSADYKNVSGTMQQTMVKVVNEDLRHHLSHIKASTLLVWGENDEATPVADAKLMEELLPDAGLVVLENAGHYSYLDKLNQFLLVLDSFLQKDKEGQKP